MDSVTSPEEKGKKLLSRQAQEQMRLQQQKIEDEKDEEIKLRRMKERLAMAFMTYAKIMAEEEKNRKEHPGRVGSLLDDFARQHAQQAQLFARMQLKSLERHDAAASEFLYKEESKEEKEQRDVVISNAGMDRSEFSAVVIAVLCKIAENLEDIGKVFTGKKPSDNLKAQRGEALNKADDAVLDFSRGNVKKMEKIISEGLVNACHAFSHSKDTLDAIHWSKQINSILCVVTSHPVLFKDGPNTPLLEAATGMAGLGRMMENGLKALDEFYTAQLNGVKLSEEKEMNLQSQILLMQQIDSQRSSEKYQKFFAKGYNPKKGYNQESLNSLLNKLNASKAINTLSQLDNEDKLFILSDAECRRSLCEDLLVQNEVKKEASSRHTEKNISVPVVHN